MITRILVCVAAGLCGAAAQGGDGLVAPVGYACGAVAEGCCSGCGELACCCRSTCVATVEQETVEKHCWNIECEEVCVPRVVAPWASGGSGLSGFGWLTGRSAANCGDVCCTDACGAGCVACGGAGCPVPRCGRVITVRDLKKETYECEVNVCKWEIRRLPPCCCDGAGCGCGGCAAGCGAVCDPSCGANASPAPATIQTVSADLAVGYSDRSVAQGAEEVAEAPESEGASTPWYRRLFR